jgi:hypothetical protein
LKVITVAYQSPRAFLATGTGAAKSVRSRRSNRCVQRRATKAPSNGEVEGPHRSAGPWRRGRTISRRPRRQPTGGSRTFPTIVSRRACHIQHASQSRTTEFRPERHGRAPVMRAHSRGPDGSDALEMQGWMSGVRLEQIVVLIGKKTDLLRQRPIERPKARGGEVPQSSRARPSLRSARDSSSSLSSLPERASLSI